MWPPRHSCLPRVGAVEPVERPLEGHPTVEPHHGGPLHVLRLGTLPPPTRLGNPWDEVTGFDRPMDQTTETKRKIRFSNEQAVGLRAHDEKYEKGTTLQDKRYKATRKVRSTEEDGKASQSDSVEFTYVPTKEEKRLPRFKNKDNKD